MTESCDALRKLRAYQSAYKRHKRLRAAEEQGDNRAFSIVDAAHTEPLYERNGKCIRRKSYGDKKRFEKTHFFTSESGRLRKKPLYLYYRERRLMHLGYRMSELKRFDIMRLDEGARREYNKKTRINLLRRNLCLLLL